MATFAITGSAFACESAPGVNGVSQLHLTTSLPDRLTAAGVLAVLGEIGDYLTSTVLGKVARQIPTGAGVEVHLTPFGASFPVLTADVASEVANLATIVQTAANVTV